MTKRLVFAMFFLLAAVIPGRVRAQDWKATLSAAYLTGTYGTDTRIDTVYVPLTIKRYFDGIGDLSLTVPFIDQTSTGEVTFVNGAVFRTRGTKHASTTESGIGDIFVKGTFYVMQESRTGLFDLSLAGKIKFPTADRDKGLGTGRFDETVGIELGRSIGPDWTGFLDVYHTFIGTVSGLGLRDTTAVDAGASYKWMPDTTVSFFYSEATPIVSNVEDLRDLLANAEYRFSDAASIFAGIDVGLSPSSPNFGMTGGISYRF